MMTEKYLMIAALTLATTQVSAQVKDLTYKFYGQVRTDLYYNSRANEETVDGLFYLFPKDHNYDPDGEDLNATPQGSFYTLYTRLGLDVKGLRLGNVDLSAKLEADFRGSGTTLSVVRLRHAYLQLDWGQSALLLGQTWHPLRGEVAPQLLNLDMGAPFNPWSRAPQLRYRYHSAHFQLTAAAVWQSQFLSQGPDGKSQKYLKNSCIPELYLGADYHDSHWLVGAGIEMISLKPRTESTVGDQTFKVDERVTSLSLEAHARYTSSHWAVAAKSVLGSNLTHVSMLGGYGVKSVDARTGEQQYSPNRNSSTWLNVVYGKRWKPSLFFGYMKNLGTTEGVTRMIGTGTHVDQLTNVGFGLTYNVPHWRIGFEYNYATAWYGSLDPTDGQIVDTHSVSNHRLMATALFTF